MMKQIDWHVTQISFMCTIIYYIKKTQLEWTQLGMLNTVISEEIIETSSYVRQFWALIGSFATNDY